MSTYCISDIHGYFNEFQQMLKLINFQESDELYVLGDIIDRGPASAEMLWWATKQAPANIHFLLGNHEDMMLAAADNYYNRFSIELRIHDSGAYNGGMETIEQIRHFDNYYEEGEQEILNGIDLLPIYYDIKIDDRRFILVHAGLQSDTRLPDDYIDGSTKNGYIEISGCQSPHNIQAMIGNRNSGINNKFDGPFDIVCGHTPTCSRCFEVLSEFGFEMRQATEGKIIHSGSRHFIDCGVNRGYFLGCLRLEDMMEFYVKSEVNV